MGSEAIIVFLLAGIVLVAGANFLSNLLSPKSDNTQKTIDVKKLHLLLLILLTLTNCENDAVLQENAKPTQTTKEIKNISFEELKLKIVKETDIINKLSKKNNTAKAKFDDDDFIYELDSIKEFTQGNYHSYTINAHKKVAENNSFLYKVLVEKRNDTISSKIITFEYQNKKFVPKSVSDFNLKKINGRYAPVDALIIFVEEKCTCHDHSDGSSCDHPTTTKYALGIGSTTGSGSTSSSGNSTTTYNSYGGGGSSTTVVLSPYEEEIFEFRNFTETLSVENKQILIDSKIGITIFNLLKENEFNPEIYKPLVFALEFLKKEPLTNYVDLQKLLNDTQNSPFNIDRLSIPYNLTKPENQNFNELYDILKTSPTFKELFIDLFQDDKRFNVKFEIADHVFEDNDPAKKEVHATTSQDPVTKNITIKISKQILSPDGTMRQTKIENAKTILHECIHAYLFTISSNPLVGKDIAEVINTVLPTVAEQHDFMYNKMIPTMVNVLSQIKDLLVTPANNLEMKDNVYVHIPFNYSPSTHFDWNDYYHNLALAGLQSCAFFKNEIGTFNSAGQPLITINQTLMQSFVEYIRLGHQNIHP